MARIDGPLGDALADLLELGFADLYLQKEGAPPAVLEPRPASSMSPPPSEARPLSPESRLASLPAESSPPAETRLASLERLAAEAQVCESCRLCRTRNKVVFGSGDPRAALMFVGEGPGAEEDRQGLPFVGPAGELLTKIIQAIGLERDQVYIANVVKCRPPGNRDPMPDEAAACRRFLEGQIAAIEPKVIVALGRVAAQTLLGTDLPLGQMRGRWFAVQGRPVRVTYHPAALLRTPAWKRPTWEDMQVVRDRLGEVATGGTLEP